MPNNQIELLLSLVRDVLRKDFVAAYLFGSAVLGGLRPDSDLDVMIVSARPSTHPEKQRLASQLLQISGRPRHLELTIVVAGDIRPWRYPPRMDFQYGDWWRHEFERGEVEPWASATNPDLASLIRMVLLADTPLHGPPPGDIFEPVPRSDYVAAQVQGIDELIHDIDSDTRNVVLTLARIWSGVVTDQCAQKTRRPIGPCDAFRIGTGASSQKHAPCIWATEEGNPKTSGREHAPMRSTWSPR